MKLKFKHQKFQADAAKAVTDVFAGQPYETSTYMIDQGRGNQQGSLFVDDFTGFKNHRIVPGLTNEKILNNIRNIQRSNLIKPSDKLEGTYNLTIEMETGVGKTYTLSRPSMSSTSSTAGASSSLLFPALQFVKASINPLK